MTTKEKWKDIKNYEDVYKVSNMGRVKSFKSGQEIILKPGDGKYLGVHLYKGGKSIRRNIHRLVAKAFVSNENGKPQVNHIDGNKHNNKASNLEWTTQRENVHHAIKMEKFTIGEKNGLAKFTNKEIRHIRDMYEPHCSRFGGTALAKKYGVSNKTMHLILNNKTYINI